MYPILLLSLLTCNYMIWPCDSLAKLTGSVVNSLARCQELSTYSILQKLTLSLCTEIPLKMLEN